MSIYLAERADINQYRGKVNELAFIKHLRGSLTPEEQREHDRNASFLGDNETNIQHERAKAQAAAFIEHAGRHGYSGVKAVHHTAFPGDIGRITGHDQSQQENPSDAVVEFAKGPSRHLGASLKSTAGKQIGFHNGGAGTIGRELGLDLESGVRAAHQEFAKKNKLPMAAGERKKAIKANPALYDKAKKAAQDVHADVADRLHAHYQTMDQNDLKHHFMNTFLKAGQKANPVPYVKVTGTGSGGKKGFGAHTEHHDDNPVANTLKNARNVSTRRSGKGYIHVLADGKHIFSIQAKHNSTGMATSMKLLGQPATMKDETHD